MKTLKSENILPAEWPSETVSSDLNLVKLEYNAIRLLYRDEVSLDDEHISLGTMLFVERQKEPDPMPQSEDDLESKWNEIASLSPSYRRSPLAVLYEEQRLKISVQFNDPLPAKSATERIEELLMSSEMLSRKRQAANSEKVFPIDTGGEGRGIVDVLRFWNFQIFRKFLTSD